MLRPKEVQLFLDEVCECGHTRLNHMYNESRCYLCNCEGFKLKK